MKHPILDIWHHTSADGAPMPILPDGCRDVIVMRPPQGAPDWFLSTLQAGVHHTFIAPNTVMTGYRLQPGQSVKTEQLARAIAHLDPSEDITGLICEVTMSSPNLDEALALLSENHASVRAASHHLGLSEQSLQRLMRRHGLPPANFWVQLGRARLAGLEIAAKLPMAAIAHDHGYADQAHMSRAIRRFFGVSPRALAKDRLRAQQLSQPGFATGEQISTK